MFVIDIITFMKSSFDRSNLEETNNESEAATALDGTQQAQVSALCRLVNYVFHIDKDKCTKPLYATIKTNLKKEESDEERRCFLQTELR